VAERLWRTQQAFRVALAGGVFQNSPLVRQVFSNSLRSVHPEAEIDAKVIEPAEGALWLARKNQ
jgi:hypothetical protein